MEIAQRASVVNTLTTRSATTTTTATVTIARELVSNVPTGTHSPTKGSALTPQIKYENEKQMVKEINERETMVKEINERETRQQK